MYFRDFGNSADKHLLYQVEVGENYKIIILVKEIKKFQNMSMIYFWLLMNFE